MTVILFVLGSLMLFNQRNNMSPLFCLISLLVPLASVAAPLPAPASQLKSAALTPLGAERQGNAEQSIPAWTGGITSPPAGYKEGEQHIDPYAEDKKLFTINAANADQYSDNLSSGQQALLKAYPDSWVMNIYPSRRSASYPEWVYAAIVKNATTAELIREGKGGVLKSQVSSPFPVPSNGLEAIWNHNLRWRGMRISRSNGTAAVTRDGLYNVVLQQQEIVVPYAFKNAGSFKERHQNMMLAFKTKTIQPALLSGNAGLFYEPINQTQAPRKSWIYSRNARRIIRVFAEYDFPAPNSDNLRTIDEFELFSGAPDRFDWKLLGKQEMYIPYNAYRLHSDKLVAADILAKQHINPALARYELHRVWKLEGTLKPGKRHIYSRRVLYL
ncbi:MAG: DUF1329 domain-containing protein, partial [Methyloprofundus sp.]|nr:DUF1329 domain-containing protein [Methyloprofundus sp.]